MFNSNNLAIHALANFCKDSIIGILNLVYKWNIWSKNI